MYALVEFSNESYYICKVEKLRSINGNTCVVRYNGGHYDASIIQRSPILSILHDYKSKLENPRKGREKGSRLLLLFLYVTL